MSSEYACGNRVKVTFEGTVNRNDVEGNVYVVTNDGYCQRFYGPSVESDAVKAETVVPLLEDGALYQDKDGEILLYDNGWYTTLGSAGEFEMTDEIRKRVRKVDLPYHSLPW
jgi:hypothetical protein